jgi:hypothetical protein
MSLIDGEQTHLPAFQILKKSWQHEPLWRDIKQPKLALMQSAQS